MADKIPILDSIKMLEGLKTINSRICMVRLRTGIKTRIGTGNRDIPEDKTGLINRNTKTNSHLINKMGHLINKMGHFINKMGHLINKMGHLINKMGHLINKMGHDSPPEKINFNKINRNTSNPII